MARSTSVGVLPFLSRKYKAMQVTPFNFDQYQIRTMQDDGGEIWFVAQDVCEAIDLDDTSKAVSRLDDDEKGTNTVRTPSGEQQMLTISESGLYSLVLTSRKPEAKRFKKWVTSEVLPSIRKNGSYSMAQPKATADLPDLVSACNALVASVDAKVLPKKDCAELIRAITLASFHGASVLMAASKATPKAKALPAPTQATLANGDSVPYELRAKGTKSATELLRIHGVSVQARSLYEAMESQDMVTTRYGLDADDDGVRVLISDGLQYGQNVMLFESKRSNPYFYYDKFAALLNRVGFLVDDTPKHEIQEKQRLTAAENLLQERRATMWKAWLHGGKGIGMLDSGVSLPYVSRDSLIDYLVKKYGKSQKTACNMAAPSGDMMKALQLKSLVQKHSKGWLITDQVNLTHLKFLD